MEGRGGPDRRGGPWAAMEGRGYENTNDGICMHNEIPLVENH